MFIATSSPNNYDGADLYVQAVKSEKSLLLMLTPRRRLELLNAFDEHLNQHGPTISDQSPLRDHLAFARLYSEDSLAASQEDLAEYWSASFAEFYEGSLVTDRFLLAVIPLLPMPGIASRLRKVARDSLADTAGPNESRDTFFELEVAQALLEAGFTVEFAEPDIVASGNGLQHRFGLACKYPSSDRNIGDRISDAWRQIEENVGHGCPVLGLDQVIVPRTARYLDFRRVERNPVNSLQIALDERLAQYVADRQLAISERPLNAVMGVVSACGILGSPAQLVMARAASFVVTSNASEEQDLRTIANSLARLR